MEVVLLDAVGTLIRLREPVEETYTAVAARFGVRLDPEELSHAFDEVFGDMPALAFQWTSMGDLYRQERNWWWTLVDRVIDLLGRRIGDFDSFFDALYRYYAQGSAWECFPDVLPALNSLRARNYRLAIVSNADSRLPGILQDLEVKNQVEAVIYSSRVGSAKPHPEIFRQALALFGVAPERAIHVGDSPRADVQGAAAAGITGLLIQRERATTSGSESAIGSLAELLSRLEDGNY